MSLLGAKLGVSIFRGVKNLITNAQAGKQFLAQGGKVQTTAQGTQAISPQMQSANSGGIPQIVWIALATVAAIFVLPKLLK